jgi:hypothetical protein
VRLAAVLLAAATTLPAQTQAPDISGRWTYNAAQSDNPRGMMQPGDSGGSSGERGGRRARGGGGYPGMGGGGTATGGGYGGGFGGMRPPDMTDQQRERMRQTMELVFRAPPALAIAQTDSTVTFAADTGVGLVIPANGRKVKQQVPGAADVEIKGRWQGYDFVVERSVTGGGGKVTEDYLRSRDGKQLFVIVNFESGRGRAVTFRRIYDLAQ